VLAESPAEGRLGRKTQDHRHLGDRMSAIGEQVPRALHTPLVDIALRRLAGDSLERTGEMKAAEIRHGSQVVEADIRLDVVLDVIHHLANAFDPWIGHTLQ